MFEPGFIFVGAIVGLAVGATGVGGGSLMTPALILFYGVAPAMAVGTDLLYAVFSKSLAAVLLGRRNGVDWPIVGWLSLGSLPAAVVTLVATRKFLAPAELDHLISVVLSAAVVLTALFMLVQEAILRRVRADSSRPGLFQAWRRGITVFAGALIGALVTVSSVGAGVIGLALLMLLYPRAPALRLVGCDLVHAVLVTAVAGLGHAAVHDVNYPMLIGLVAGSIPGIWLGTRVALHLRDRALKRAIATVLLLAGMTTLAHATVT